MLSCVAALTASLVMGISVTPEEGVGGLAFIQPCGGGLIGVEWGFGRAVFIDVQGGINDLACPWLWEEVSCTACPSSAGDLAAYCTERDDGRYLIFIDTESLSIFGPFRSLGRPGFDGLGNVWFTADGELMRQGIGTGIDLDAFSISPDSGGSYVAWCDGMDRVCLTDTETGETTILSDLFRFYDPRAVLLDGSLKIIAPTLEGSITMSDPDGTCTVLAEGTHPFWCQETGELIYCKVEDDGHYITSSEILTLIPGEEPIQVTQTDEYHEINPVCSGGNIFAIDSRTGILLRVNR